MNWKFACLVLSLTAVLFAQGQGKNWSDMSAEERAEKSTQRMAETLELNEEQKEKVLAATMRQIESMDEVQSREERMKGMQKAMETYEQEMQEILTEKQYEEFQIMRRKRLKRMRQRRRMMGEEEGFR
jgi:protein CpxP